MLYDIIQKPPRGRSEEGEYYIVPAYGPTIDEKQMTENIVNASTLTQGDVQAAITAITGEMAKHLREGHKVKISGLGTFRLRLTTPKKDLKADDKVAKRIEAHDVVFRPERNFMRQFSNMSFTRTDHPRTLRRVTGIEELLAKLRAYFTEHEFLRRPNVEALAHCGHSTASKYLRTLAEQGYIVNIGLPNNPIYRPTSALTSED